MVSSLVIWRPWEGEPLPTGCDQNRLERQITKYLLREDICNLSILVHEELA